MIRKFSVNFAIFSIILDFFLVGVALLLADIIRPYFNVFDFARTLPPDVHVPWIVYPFFSITWVFVLFLFSIYDGRKNIRFFEEVRGLTFGTGLASVASAGGLYISYRDVSRLLFLLFVAITFSLLLGWRLFYRLLMHWRGFHLISCKVLIIGAGKVGMRARENIISHERYGLKFVGFLDDEVTDPDVKGYLKDLKEIAAIHQIDDVIIALPRHAYQRVTQLVTELHDLPVRVWVIPDYFSLVLHHAETEEFAGITMMNLRAPALDDFQRMVKRIFDISITLLAMPILLPVMGCIAVAIKIWDPGPIFFKQNRVGENGKLFKMIKFRSMIVDAEKKLQEVIAKNDKGVIDHKRPDDPRITRLGRLLRRTSLDELPQFFNVLIGEMSLVGPRPELPTIVDQYESWQRKRFAMPPGITGWWQVQGRSDRPMHLNTEDDLYYVQNYSIWLDLKILFKTAWVVLRGEGAY